MIDAANMLAKHTSWFDCNIPIEIGKARATILFSLDTNDAQNIGSSHPCESDEKVAIPKQIHAHDNKCACVIATTPQMQIPNFPTTDN